jgi:hypothetical protein
MLIHRRNNRYPGNGPIHPASWLLQQLTIPLKEANKIYNPISTLTDVGDVMGFSDPTLLLNILDHDYKSRNPDC